MEENNEKKVCASCLGCAEYYFRFFINCIMSTLTSSYSFWRFIWGETEETLICNVDLSRLYHTKVRNIYIEADVTFFS